MGDQGPRRQQNCLAMRLEERYPVTTFQRALKAFGIYALGTGELRKVLEPAGDRVRAVLK